jgi:hypothetical protein
MAHVDASAARRLSPSASVFLASVSLCLSLFSHLRKMSKEMQDRAWPMWTSLQREDCLPLSLSLSVSLCLSLSLTHLRKMSKEM